MTTDISTAKVITQHAPRDFDATFDGNYIGSFRTRRDAEIALDDHVMDLIERGLIDQPLAALDAQPCIHCGAVQERASCDACVAWPEVEQASIPSADWGTYATGDINTCACGTSAIVLLHGVHDTLDIALCYRCHGAYCSMEWPEPIAALADAQALDTFQAELIADLDTDPTYHAPGHCRNCGEAHHIQRGSDLGAALRLTDPDDGPPPPWDAPAIVRKTIVAWQCNRTACAQWLNTFGDAEQRMLAQAVIAYRRQWVATDLTVERLIGEWKGGAY